jgi:hypothetical protein
MDHAEVRERLELAAVEPSGLERLMAGDTPEAAGVAGHLAGCQACVDELRRLQAGAGLIRRVVATTAPPVLRDRTLAYVAELGRDRSVGPATTDRPMALHPIPEAGPDRARRLRRPAQLGWIAAIAAAVVIAVAGTALVTGTQRDATLATRDAELERRADAVAALERVTSASIDLAAQPDAAHVSLASTGLAGGDGAAGSLLFSPATRRLVVVATGLPRPDAGREFRCWVEDGGERRPVGRMYFAEDLSFWVGEVEAVANLRRGSTFGVTLVEAGGDALDGPPTLVGEL